MEELSRRGGVSNISIPERASSSATTTTLPPTSSSTSGPLGGGRPPLWMGLLLVLALVFMTVAHGGSTGHEHENLATGVDASVGPSTPSPIQPQTPPPPITNPPESGGSTGPTGGFKIFESLLGGKGTKSSKQAAVAASLANEPAPTGNAEEKEEELVAAAVVSLQGHADGKEVVPDVKSSILDATPAATATVGAAVGAAAAAPDQPPSPEAAAAAAQAHPPPQPLASSQSQTKADHPSLNPPKSKVPQAEVNYAAEKAGAVVLQSSSSLVGAKNLLDDDKDKYARSPCAESKWVIINLSEDIRIHALVLANYEKFSSMVKDFHVWYSVKCPSLDGDEDSEGWLELGSFEARQKTGEQRFVVDPPRYARYLKVRLVSHWNREFYCTLSQIKVLGSTLQQGFMDDWQKQKLNLGSQLEVIDPAATVDGGRSSSSSNQTCLPDGTCTTQKEGKHAAEGVEVEAPPSSSSGSTDGGDTNGLKIGERGGEALPQAADDGAGIERQAASQPDGQQKEHHLQLDEKDDPQQAKDKGMTSQTFAESLGPVDGGRSVDVEKENGKTPSLSDEKPPGGEAAATEPPVLEPNAEGAIRSGENLIDESLSSPVISAVEPGKGSNGEGNVKEGAAAAAGGELHKKDGTQTGDKGPAPAAEPPLQGATGEHGPSTPSPLLLSQDISLPTPTTTVLVSEGTSVEGASAEKKQDTPERDATVELAPPPAAAAAAAISGGVADLPPNPVDGETKENSTASLVVIEEGVVTPVPAAADTAATSPSSPPEVTATPTTTSTVVATVSGAPAKTELMSRFRHECLQQMRLGDFKKQKLSKLQEDLGAKGEGAAAASLGSGSPYDNIFNTLMDEMTSLEINQSIFDVYVSNLHSCFVQVMDDVLLEQDRARMEAGEMIAVMQRRLQDQATVNEKLLHQMHRLENSFLVGVLAWLVVLGFLVLLACSQLLAWKRLRRTAVAGEEHEQQPDEVRQS